MFNAVNTNRKRPFKAVAGASSSASSSKNKGNDNNNNNPNAGIGGNTSNIKDKNFSTPPTTIEINGIEVHFPFKPYDVQRDYMRGVLTALQNGQHALLESPTGTGKTLCLLCSALAWQRQEKGRIAMTKMDQQQQHPNQLPVKQQSMGELTDRNNGGIVDATNLTSSTTSNNKHPVIIYASRTHSQLSQVVNELRNTRYRPRHAVLGSREHMCIHPKVNPSVANKGRSNNSTSSGSDFYSSDTPALSSEFTSSCPMDVNNGCNKLNKERKCMYRNNLDDKSAAVPVEGYSTAAGGGLYEQPVMDMEDLVAFGKLNKVCPFYHTRSLLKDAELLFVPYNYLFDRDARESSLAEIDFQNSILIFDEAHNLEEFASESASFDLGSGDLAGCVGEVQRALQYMEVNVPENDGMGGLSKQNVIHLKSVLLRFEKYLIESTDINGSGDGGLGGDSSSYPGEYIFDIFQRGAGINHDNLQIFINFVKQVGDFVTDFKGCNNSTRNASSGTPKLDHFLNCLKRAFGSGTHLLALARAKSYRVHVTKIAGGGGYSGGRTISFWCFAPALAMRELTFLKVRSIIITSGTLSPLPSFSMELGLKFPVQLENDHVIQTDQIFVRVIGKGVSGKELTSKFGRRDDPEYILELGNTLASLCTNIPGGVLVFFPSYVAMEAAIQRWGGPSSERNNARQSGRGAGRGAAFFAAAKRKAASAKYVFPLVPNHFRATTIESSPWQRLLARKSIVLEPRSTSELNDAISEYKKIIGTPKSTGAILMGVCRGKISEGIDFSDDMCRAVIVTGLPFAPYLDPKVRLKREFLDAARASAKARPSIDGGFGNGKMPHNSDKEAASKTLSGAEWYNQQAHRAVNQAIGRVIRHRHDYGAVLLLDHRFAEVRNKDGLSKWLRPHLRDETIGASTRGLVQFYRKSKINADKYKEVSQQPKLNERPVIKYEQNDEIENIVSKVTVVHKGATIEDTLSNGYVPENLLLEKYDLNNLYSPPSQVNTSIVVDKKVVDDGVMVASISERPCAGLGAMYNKANQISSLLARPSQEAQKSSFEGVECDFGDSARPIINEKVISRPQPRGNKDAATRHAKIFFEKAKDALDKDDLLKLNKLLVTMKTYGDEKNEQQYIKAAKELMAVLVDSQVNTTRIQLISSLFPLLPIKYRYKFEKMAAALVFDNSPLTLQYKHLLREDELSSIRNHVIPLIFKQAAANDCVSDRAYLEDTQKILTVMVTNQVNLQYLYELLPARQLMKVRALAIEMERSRDIANAKARSACFKGEVCVNSALFQPADKLPAVACIDPSLTEDVESQRMMSQALIQGLGVNRQRFDRVREIMKTSSTATHFNPYQRTALKESTQKNQLSARSPNNHADISRKKNGGSPVSRSNLKTHLDIVDECLNQVKSDCFVEPISKLERINGKIKAYVPNGMTCMVCNETLDQPLMSESCRHSACFNCWRTWLQRSNTCPTCRAPTTMNDLSKLVFTSKTGAGAPTLTQICASDNEEESDDDELVIVSN